MDYSELDIWNIALHAIGAEAIQDKGADHKANRMCRSFYGWTRDYLLTTFDWNFARKYQVLTLDDTYPEDNCPSGYYPYALPEDCEIPRSLEPYKQRDSWMIMGNHLFSPRDELVGMYYTRNDVTAFDFSTAFSQLMALGMAVRLAPAMAQDDTLTEKLYAQFVQEVPVLTAVDANASNDYRAYQEDPNNDTFVHPELAGFLDTPIDGRT